MVTALPPLVPETPPVARVSLRWEDEARALALMEFAPHWTWEEFHQQIRQAELTLKGRPNVNLIIHVLPDAHRPPGDALSHFRQGLRYLPSNVETVTIVGLHSTSKTMLAVLTRVYRNLDWKIRFAESLEEARHSLPQHLPPLPDETLTRRGNGIQ